MVKAVIFDLDNTLLWDDKSVEKAFIATCQLAVDTYEVDGKQLEEYVRIEAETLYPTYDVYDFVSDIEISTFEAFWGHFRDEGEEYAQLRSILTDFREKAWYQGLQKCGVDDRKLAEQMAHTFPEERRKHIFLYEETIEVLETLSEHYELLLLTNGSPDLQWEKLNMSPELKRYFKYIVISGDFGSGKPDPAIFEHALELLSVEKNEAIMVGDNLYTDILGASKIGMDSVWINHHDVEHGDVRPTYIVERLADLLPIIEQK